MKDKTKRLIIRELFILLAVVFVGWLIIIDATKSWRYPMSVRPELKPAELSLGKGIAMFGYPLLAAVRLLVWRFKQFQRGTSNKQN